MKSKSQLPATRSCVQVTTDNERYMFLHYENLTLIFKNGTLGLAGENRPGIFRVPLENVQDIHWKKSGWAVNFRVKSEVYHVAFSTPQAERIMTKNSFLLRFGMLGAIVAHFLLLPHLKKAFEFNQREADKWRAILKNDGDN